MTTAIVTAIVHTVTVLYSSADHGSDYSRGDCSSTAMIVRGDDFCVICNSR